MSFSSMGIFFLSTVDVRVFALLQDKMPRRLSLSGGEQAVGSQAGGGGGGLLGGPGLTGSFKLPQGAL